MMRAIVTTTINPPTKALHLFAQKKDWHLFIIGDLATPHDQFRDFENQYPYVTYMSPEDQEKRYKKLSDAIGWKKIQRRNIGYVEAYNNGYEIIASVDDDNIPLKGWGENLFVGTYIKVNYYKEKNLIFDPVGATNTKKIWHRGFPLQLVSSRNYSKPIKKRVKCDIQADFWNGDPDVDAVCRMIYSPNVKYRDNYFPLASNKISPFNSQNTFFTRAAIRNYFLFPDVGRMDDIWGSYYLLSKGYRVVYGKASVYQDRNSHDLTKDMIAEYLGYENNINLVNSLNQNPESIKKFLPKSSYKAFQLYRDAFK